MQEAGRVLMDKFDGTFRTCLELANKNVQKLISIIVENFSSYRDECTFEGKTVKLHKRAQILVADIWACFEGKNWGEFEGIDSITMFADYRYLAFFFCNSCGKG